MLMGENHRVQFPRVEPHGLHQPGYAPPRDAGVQEDHGVIRHHHRAVAVTAAGQNMYL
jgi:hypothetical protein